jgi:hypothetical protein
MTYCTYQISRAKNLNGQNTDLFALMRDGTPICWQSKPNHPAELAITFQQYVFADIVAQAMRDEE